MQTHVSTTALQAGHLPLRKAVFIDKDGTLIPDIPYNVDPSLISLAEGVADALQLLSTQNYLFVIVTNQAGVAHGYFKVEALQAVQQRITELLANIGISLAGFYFCPHHTNAEIGKYRIDCNCRKPKPGMILRAAKELNIDLPKSWMIGDILNDVEAGNAAGCRSILIDNGGETEWIITKEREPNRVVKNFKQAAEWIAQQTMASVQL
jgi:D-glycero-D-manno-heptose 1,7-bisphosphate phosphatase